MNENNGWTSESGWSMGESVGDRAEVKILWVKKNI